MEIQWALVFYTILIGASVGAFILVAFSELKGVGEKYRLPVSVISLVLLALGGLSSVLHLEHPERAANIFGNFGSPITKEMYLAFTTGLFIVLYIVMLRIAASRTAKKVFAVLGLISGLALAAVSGLIYVLPARPAWNSWYLPLIFITTGLSLGMFIVYVWSLWKKSEDQTMSKNTLNILLGLLVVEAALLVGYLMFLSTNIFQDPSRTSTRLLTGSLAPLFWLGVVLIGLVLPLFLVIQSLRSKPALLSPITTGVLGIAGTLVGSVAFRVMLYMIGTTVEKF